MAPAVEDSFRVGRIAVVLATVAVASACVAPQPSLQQVRADNPSVTYAYSNDEDLLRASQEAVTFCSRYNASPGPARITSSSSTGAKSVVFECGPNAGATVGVPQQTVVVPRQQQTLAPNLTYSYRTDEELLAAARTAEAYCATSGTHGVVSSIAPNTDGSKTVVFQCARA
jgi:hypothetical protein